MERFAKKCFRESITGQMYVIFKLEAEAQTDIDYAMPI